MRSTYICPNCNLNLQDEAELKPPAERAVEYVVKVKEKKKANKKAVKKLQKARKNVKKRSNKKVAGRAEG